MRILGINALFHDPAAALVVVGGRTVAAAEEERFSRRKPGKPRFPPRLRQYVHATGDGGFRAHGVDRTALAPPRPKGEERTREHADLAAGTRAALEELLLELVHWLHRETGGEALTMAGGVALNCVAHSGAAERGPYRHVWVRPEAGDAGTALGVALRPVDEPQDRAEKGTR
jgi:carbamoyltransferase